MLYMFLLWLLIGFGGEWLFWVWIGLVAVLIGFGGEWLFCVWVGLVVVLIGFGGGCFGFGLLVGGGWLRERNRETEIRDKTEIKREE